MMYKKFYIGLVIFLSSCNDLIIKEHIINDYYLVAPDTKDQLALCYHTSNDGDSYGVIVGETICAVGFNEKYIIVLQHPWKCPNPPDTSQTYYYILPQKSGMDWSSKNGLMGPLTLEQYNEKRNELSIPNEVRLEEVDKYLR